MTATTAASSPGASSSRAGDPRLRRTSLGNIITIFASVAVITGATHAVIMELRRALTTDFTWASPFIVWMAPLGYLIYFLLAALPLVVGSIAFPGWLWSRLAAFIAFALGGTAIVLLFSRIHPIAGGVLALGVAAELTRHYSASEQAAVRTLRRTGTTLALLLAVTSVTVHVARARAERNQLRAYPAAAADAPNVLLVIFDTMRAANASLYGYPRATTPVLDSLGRGGVVFDHAFSPAPWTLPSHASMFTGRTAGSLSAAWRNRLDGAAPTLAEVLRDRGYSTAGFTANLSVTMRETGIARGFTHYEDFRNTPMQVLWTPSFTHLVLFQDFVAHRGPGPWLLDLTLSDFGVRPMIASDRKRGAQVTDDMLRWQSGAPRRPFFAFLNYYDAHDPYDPPSPYDRRFGGGATKLDRYDGGIAYADRELGRLLQELTVRGVLRNTIVIMTSDHGEHFGEHGRNGHGVSVYPQLVHVPLVIYAPNFVPAGVRVPAVISTSRLAATILDLLGTPGDTTIPGRSLADYWRGGDTTSAVPVLTEMGPELPGSRDPTPKRMRLLKAVIDDTWYYIHDGDGGEELYSYRTDSALANNLVHEATHASTVARYRATLEAMVGRNGMLGRGARQAAAAGSSSASRSDLFHWR